MQDLTEILARWGIAHKELVQALDEEEIEDLKKCLGFMIDILAEEAKAQEKAILEELLADIPIQLD